MLNERITFFDDEFKCQNDPKILEREKHLQRLNQSFNIINKNRDKRKDNLHRQIEIANDNNEYTIESEDETTYKRNKTLHHDDVFKKLQTLAKKPTNQ